MKKMLFFLLFIPILGFSQSNNYLNGYVVPLKTPNDTIFGDEILISNNGFFYVKLSEGKKKIKYEKTDLIDFGYIHEKDKKRVSKYAELAFFEPTYRACYLYGFNQDTMLCFIGRKQLQEPTFTKVKCYYRGNESMAQFLELGLFDVKSFMIINDFGNEIWYDAMRLEIENREVHNFDETILVQSFVESYAPRLAEGQLRVNETEARIRGVRRKIYILTKNYKTTILFIGQGLLNINAKEKLNELIADAPHLLKKLHEKGYKYHDIPTLIQEYNEFKLDL